MSEKNKAVARRWVEEVQNQHNFELIDELVAADVTNHTPIPGMPEAPPGREPLKKLQMGLAAAFSGSSININAMIAEGEKVVTYKTFEGTHTGELFGVPATGKSVKFDIIDIWGFVDGKMRDHWAVADMMSMMQQLGVAPPPG